MSIKVKVRWFDRSSGEGTVRDSDGNTAWLYACNIPGKKTWFANTACVYFNEGEEIEVEQEDGFIIPLTQGHFDSEKWASLDHDSLAFRCDDEGKAICGLFASKRSKRKAM